VTPRIANRRDYPDFVQTATATTHDEGGASFRTILHVVFTEGEGIGVFIGANPSRALGDGGDATVNKVLRWMRTQGVGEVYVFNLSPYRATDARDAVRWLGDPANRALSDRVNAAARDKLADLFAADRPPLILAGWGDCLKQHADDRVWRWRRLLRPELTYGQLLAGVKHPLIHRLPLTKAGNPGHPLYADMNLITSHEGLP
jgi:hypothetical protein